MIGERYGAKYVPGAPRASIPARRRMRRKRMKRSGRQASRAARRYRARPRSRHGEALRADLEARGREPDGKRRTGAHHHRCGLADNQVTLRATGTVTLFDGFLTLYQEGKDDESTKTARSCRSVAPAKPDGVEKVTPAQHFTEPPPRYSEASLVRKLEELGIGRPSTYASILSTLRDRAYVRMDRNRFIPEDKGRIVTTFLANFFGRYVEYGFTADLEEKLDEVSAGELSWKQLLRDFWKDFSAAIGETKDLKISEVITELDEILGPHIFPPAADGTDPRKCPELRRGRLSLKLGKFGSFVGCSNYPECRYTRQIGQTAEEAGDGAAARARQRSRNGRADHAAQRPLRSLCATGRRREAEALVAFRKARAFPKSISRWR
jgi:DNA topoisomerase-1